MITREMIEKGYEMGIVRLRELPNNDYVWCEIGDNDGYGFSFAFGGEGADGEVLKEFSEDVPTEEIVNELFEVFEGIRCGDMTGPDAYAYYEEFFKKNLDPVGYLREQAEKFVRENPELAREVSRLVEKENHRAEIASELKAVWKNGDKLTDDAIEMLVDRVEEYSENFDRMSKDVVGEIVDSALRAISSIGEEMGSGRFDLRTLEVDGKTFTLYVDIRDLEEDYTHGRFYEVYYAVAGQDGDNLYSRYDWTSGLDVEELKRTVLEIANTDFRMMVLECLMQQNTLQETLASAEAKAGCVPNKEIEQEMDL